MNKKIITQLSLVAALAVVGTAAFFAFKKGELGNGGPAAGTQNPVREEGDGKTATSAEARAKQLAGNPSKSGASGSPANVPLSASYGELKPMSPDVSPQAKAAAEAAFAKNHPERLSCAIAPAKFDAKKWADDPAYRAEYLRVPEPARCYQTAVPGKDVQRIALASPAYVETLQGQAVELRVKGSPGFPVTFTSFDAAMFTESKLTTQTVVTNAEGIASVQLLATPGVIEDCRVIASCPVNAGLAKIVVHVRLPSIEQPVPAETAKPAASLTDAASSPPLKS